MTDRRYGQVKGLQGPWDRSDIDQLPARGPTGAGAHAASNMQKSGPPDCVSVAIPTLHAS